MGNVNSYTVVTVCTVNEAKTLLSSMISNYCQNSKAQIEPKEKLLEILKQTQKICEDEEIVFPFQSVDDDDSLAWTYDMCFMMEMIRPDEHDAYETSLYFYYLINGLVVIKYHYSTKYSGCEYLFRSLSRQIGELPFFALENPEEWGHQYIEISDFEKDGEDFTDAVSFFTNFYDDPDRVWELLMDGDDYISEVIRGALSKPAPDSKKIISDPKKMSEIEKTDKQEFLRQRRLIADLALWDGWDPAQLQLYIDYLDGKGEPEEAESVSKSPFCLFQNIVAPLEDYEE